MRDLAYKALSVREELIKNEATLPDAIATFLGVLELIKIRKLLLSDEVDEENALLNAKTRFILNTDSSTVENSEYLPDEADENK